MLEGPDRGIWEIRGEPQHFTFSKVMCWVAADRGARLAALRGERDRADAWWAAAQEIHADICEKGVGDRGVFTQSYGSNELDASLAAVAADGVPAQLKTSAFARPFSRSPTS